MSVKKIFSFARPFYGQLFFGILLAFTGVSAALVPPEIAKRVIDNIFTTEGLRAENIEGKERELLILLTIMVGAALLRSLSMFFRNIILESFGQKVIKKLKQALYDHLQSLSFDFFHKNRTGELMARMTGDIEAIRDVLSQGTIKLCFGFFYIVMTTLVLFSLNIKLALLVALPTPFVGLMAYLFSKKMRPRFMENRERYSDLNGAVSESISGIRVVKTFNRQAFEFEKFDNKNDELAASRNRSLAVWANFMPVLELLSNLSTVLLILVGGIMAINGTITIGLWVQFSGYLWMLIMPMRMTGEVVNAFSMASTSAERVFTILETGKDIENPPNPVKPDKIEGVVEFRNVSWEREGNLILKNINLKAEKGSVVALMGSTGSGKSSLINLISRFFDPTSGEILVDNINVKDMDLKTLRCHVAMVMQEPFLFSETIYNNISYGKHDASMGDVRRSARRSHAHGFISGMTDSYDTVVGERGMGLSGGQKQRASIARALLKESPILILDDSTSAVDMETEELIQESIQHEGSETTTFIIAHRISSVVNADQILYLEDGEIVERGTHKELLALKGRYYETYVTQYSDNAQEMGENTHGQK
jgi:ATP-binding cassette subfamily B multidrug efflux pump